MSVSRSGAGGQSFRTNHLARWTPGRFCGQGSGHQPQRTWLRPLAATVAQPLAGTDGASAPFWSSDSGSIGFVADGSVKRVDAAGGLPRMCVMSPLPMNSAAAGMTTRSCFRRGLGFCAWLRRATAAVITRLDPSRGETAHRYPTFLPDGRHLLYSVQSTDPANTGVYARALARRNARPEGGVGGAEPGYLIYQDSGALMAQPFDATRLRLNGTPHSRGSPVIQTWDSRHSPSRRAARSFIGPGKPGSPVSCNGSIALANHSTWPTRGVSGIGAVPRREACGGLASRS